MKLNTKIVLKTPEGENYKDGDKELTLGTVVGATLATTKSNDPWKSYKLTNDFTKPSVDIKPEDVVFIKELLKESAYFPYIVGQVIDILDNGGEKETKE